MASLEEQFEAACAAGDIPGVVLVASDIEGKFQYQKAFGQKSPTEQLDVDATFIMASCTKLMTSIAALQCVERGQIGLDDDVSRVLTELRDIQIITGFKEGTEEPILKTAENKITLRHLLTHTAGFGTDRSDPLLTRWRESRGESLNRRNMTLVQGALKPLLFEPGTGWSYGTSTDWAGLLVMRLNDMSLEAYMQKYIWDPLGIRDITFHQELKPEVRKHLVTMTTRGRQALYSTAVKTEDKVQWTEEKLYDDPIPHESGSGGAIGSAVEFSKILHSINADDGRLLMSETIDDMFTPQLEGEVLAKFIETREPLAADGMFTAHKPGEKLQYGLAGMIVLDDTDTGLKAGTLTWSGLPTLLWTIDMESGLSLMYASNIVPFGDLKSHKMQQLFEKEMYKRLLEV